MNRPAIAHLRAEEPSGCVWIGHFFCSSGSISSRSSLLDTLTEAFVGFGRSLYCKAQAVGIDNETYFASRGEPDSAQ
jgi:hypothetical protein